MMMNKHLLTSLFLLLTIGVVFGQNVGVGTSTPVEKLHVAGTLRVDDLQTAAATTNATDKVVWVDANGKVYSFPGGAIGKVLGIDPTGKLAWLNAGLPNSLNNGQIWIGDATNTPVPQTPSGDALIDNAGVITIQDNAVDGTDISITAESNGSLMYYNGTDWVNLGIGAAGQILSIAGGIPTWINPPSAPVVGDLTTSTTGVTVTGGVGAVNGAGTTVNVATNALNQNGLVPGPTGANSLQVWGTDALGNPGWVNVSTLITTRDVLAGAGNNAVSITNGIAQVVGAANMTVNVATNALAQDGVVTGTTNLNNTDVWGTDAAGVPAWRDPNTLLIKNDVVSSNSAINVTNGIGQVVGGVNLTIAAQMNALNQNGYVPGPTIGNPNQVWATNGAGVPSWQSSNNTIVKNDLLAGVANNAVSVTNGIGQVVGGVNATINVAINALNQAGVVTGTTNLNNTDVWGTDAAGVPAWRDPNTLLTKNDVISSNTAITVTNGIGQVVGGTNLTIAAQLNALNQNGYVPGPTVGNANQVWATNGAGVPSWQGANAAIVKNDLLAGVANNAISITNGSGQVVGGVNATVNVATNALNQAGVVTGTTNLNNTDVWGTDAAGVPAWRDPNTLLTKNDVVSANSAITITNGVGQIVGGTNLTVTAQLNALNQNGYVPGPTVGNANQVWATNGAGAPSWQGANAAIVKNDIVAGVANNSVSITNGTGQIVGGVNATVNVATNALNQSGVVLAPTGANTFQVWGTNGAGVPAWVDPTSLVDVDNGLYYNGVAGKVRQGGALVEQTVISEGNFNYIHSLNGAGVFEVRNSITTGNGFFVNNNDRVGIGTASPTGKLHVNYASIPHMVAEGSSNVGTWFSLGNTDPNGKWFNIISTATANGEGAGKLLITRGVGAATTSGTLMIMDWATSNIGINTNTPVSKLDIEGNMSVGTTYSGTTAAPANGAIIEGQVGVGTSAPDASAMLDVTSSSRGLLAPRVALTATNTAGPTTLPATALLVYNTATAGVGLTAVIPGYYYNAGNGAAPNWVRIEAGGNDWHILGNANTVANTNFIGTTDNIDFVVRTNNVERTRVTAAGRTGINTASTGIGSTYPWAHLEIVGDGNTNGDILFKSVGPVCDYLTWQTAGGAFPTPALVANGQVLGYINWQAYNGTAFNNVASMTTFIEAAPGASDLPTAITFNTTPDGSNIQAERMRINNAGNIGIGIAVPLAKVDISANSSVPFATLRLHEQSVNDWARLMFMTANSATKHWVLSAYLDNVVDSISNYNVYYSQTGQNYFTVLGNGKVSIGNSPLPRTRLDVDGDLALRVAGLVLATGVNNDVNIISNQYSSYRITGPGAAFSITGLRGGVNGRIVTLYNTTAFQMTIDAANGGSNAVNQIIGTDLIINGGGSVTLQYNVTDNRWVIISNNDDVNSSAWDISGNNLSAGGVFGTLSNQLIDIYSNNLFRGRISNVDGEFAWGATASPYAGDALSANATATLPFALNGYCSQNGGAGTWGEILTPSTTNFSAVQGVYGGSGAGGGVLGNYAGTNTGVLRAGVVGVCTQSAVSAGGTGVYGANQIASGNQRMGVYGTYNGAAYGLAVVGVGFGGGIPAGNNDIAVVGWRANNQNYSGYFNGNHIIANGTKSGSVPTTKGNQLLYVMESPEVWFEDFGTGHLVNGVAEIELDDLFMETVLIDKDHPMHVFIQVNGECNDVFVTKGTHNFTVKEKQGGQSNVEFSYRVIAKRYHFADHRFGNDPVWGPGDTREYSQKAPARPIDYYDAVKMYEEQKRNWKPTKMPEGFTFPGTQQFEVERPIASRREVEANPAPIPTPLSASVESLQEASPKVVERPYTLPKEEDMVPSTVPQNITPVMPDFSKKNLNR